LQKQIVEDIIKTDIKVNIFVTT